MIIFIKLVFRSVSHLKNWFKCKIYVIEIELGISLLGVLNKVTRALEFRSITVYRICYGWIRTS